MSDTQLTQFGRYRVIAELGRGAMGVVYRAEDPLLNRTVALKTILMSSDEEERVEYEARFYQEAKAAGGLNHPNIITVHDIGRESDVAYMAMELLDGIDLRELMKRGRLPFAMAIDIAVQVAEALAFAHQHGVIHRDIKPANIMIVRDRQAKIMDFGIARMRLSDVKTQAGSMLGSPKYMSPEQVNGERADHRSDIFSLGVTVYEMVSGVAPFSAEDLGQLMYQVSASPAAPPSSIDPSLPPMMDLIVAKALEKVPDARYQDARQLAVDLRACKAQLADAGGVPQIDAGSATVDIALEKTTADASAQTQANMEASRTRRLGAMVLSGPGALQLSLSRRFDSSEAVPRLDQPAAVASASRSVLTNVKRFLQDPQQRGLAITVAVAVAVALLIALV